MKVTGYQLIDRIEVLREQSQTINGQFNGALFHFPNADDGKPDPRELMSNYLDCERRIARLQAAQAAYNVRVIVDVLGETMQLQQAVKLIGSANRIKTNWLTASKTSDSSNAYSAYYELVRSKESDYAKRVVPVEECLRLSTASSEFATALKQAIRAGNAVEIDLDLDASLFQ